jgi:hypothetical protein
MARRLAAGVKQLGDLDLAYRVQADPSTSHDFRHRFVDPSRVGWMLGAVKR